MASASTLLKLAPLHQWNPTFSYTQQNHHRTSNNLSFFSKPQHKPNPVRLQISCEHKQLNTYARYDSAPAPIWKNSSEITAVRIKKALDSLKKPAVAAVLLGFLLFYDPNCALARSGSAFSSLPSSSSSRSSSFSSSSLSQSSSSSPLNSEFVQPVLMFVAIISLFFGLVFVINYLSERYEKNKLNVKTSVVKLQVGLHGSVRTIQQDFVRLAENADTSTKEGLRYVLTEATLSLLRHLDYCISCYSSVDVKRSEKEGEDRFNRLSIEERGRFEEETLVNVNSLKQKSSKIQRASDFSNEYIVVTILVAATGNIKKLQPINGISDLKEALLTLGSIRRSRIMAVEILLTPQDENEAMSEIELLEDYPLLKPF